MSGRRSSFPSCESAWRLCQAKVGTQNRATAGQMVRESPRECGAPARTPGRASTSGLPRSWMLASPEVGLYRPRMGFPRPSPRSRRSRQCRPAPCPNLALAAVALVALSWPEPARAQELGNDRTVAELEALNRSRQDLLEWLILGAGALGTCLAVVLVYHAARVRAQRAASESEQRYRALFQTSVVPTLVIDLETRTVVDLNEPARSLCGTPRGSAPVDLAELEPEWVRIALCRLFESDTGDEAALDDCWIERSGGLRWTEIRGSKVAVDGRRCCLVSVRDTTATRVLEEAQRRQDKLASLGNLAGGIAHDFNNALTAILGHIALAREGDSAEREQVLAIAEQAAIGAQRLTAQLLAFAKGGKPVRRTVEVGKLLREAVAAAGAGSNLTIRVEIADDLRPAQLDSAQVHQVVNNLVANAAQAAGAGGELLVRATNFRGEPATAEPNGGKEWVRIDFVDDGPGIPEEARAHVFDPYFGTQAGSGGLGLASAYAICNHHGGTLTFESRPGAGATFSAFFPASTAPVSEIEPPPPADPSGGGNILVLEDEPLVQSVLRRMLARWGFTVETVTDGRIAVRRYREQLEAGEPFDLLIMDLTIPNGMGGRQAIAEILAHDPDARAIVASGYSDDPTMAHYREAGFVAALAKPFQRADLANVLNAVLPQARLEPRGDAKLDDD
ncbi:MAG: response regulator [Planctomycetes bacterium]|nr:response regulator [Planctomycetota bacterium]